MVLQCQKNGSIFDIVFVFEKNVCLLRCKMLHLVHQLAVNFFSHMFDAGHVDCSCLSGSLHLKQVHAESGTKAAKGNKTEPKQAERH